MSELITAELVDLDLSAETKSAASRSLAGRMVAAGRVTDLDGFLADVAAREAQMPTGLDGGIGIPHCRSAHVTAPTLAFGRSTRGIDFGAPDGPADLVFLIAAPAGADDDHLTMLSSLARRLMDPAFTAALRAESDPAAAAALVGGEEPPVPAEPEEASGAPEAAQEPFRIVAVTSCPTGIAHTYMAAESLEAAARAEGVLLSVETQGSAGFERLDPAVIAAADAVIWAHDVEVREKARFDGKPVVDVGVKAGINRPAELMAEARVKARRGEISRLSADRDGADDGAGGGGSAHFGVRLRTYLMSGVSYMVPFVAAGGLLIALSFAIGGYEIASARSVAEHFAWSEADSWAALLNQIGTAAFGFLVPVLAGYIAYGMADRPALVPGFVGGAIALTIDAGFLGGLVAGLLAGAVVMAIQRVKVHPTLRGIMPVLVIPLLASVAVGFLMFIVVGKPIASLQSALTDWLNGLSGSNAVVLGVVLGLMMCFDMGGPLNKVAYAFAVGGLADPTPGSLKVMAAVMAAGMVPPLAMALATTVRRRLFSRTERENGRAAWVLGASFISEGAIPFAAADPLRVIPSVMAGGAVTGALSMAFGCTLRAPHGGVFVVPLIGEPFLYLLAVAAGTAVATGLVITLKGLRRSPQAADAPAEEPKVPSPSEPRGRIRESAPAPQE
ncbi:fructose-specific PTS transporter subunit EIIC [Streptomyces sp. B1I3]|uniref:PTS fructose transporter subunit IIABC n=1 Tax=Streptomyces sp. B1I3 TaxID=3042264 RepID=UPI0027829FE7|nr:fructose-specific PTS transporter subunit EIIC [Streptomyces sp. B1I3]MDQ0791879.1 PTS system fructose-specific IIC component [Streptomyces sp. B1I3]